MTIELSTNALRDAIETPEGVRAAFGTARFERLTRVKRRYGPANTFRFDLNIPPAADPA